MMTPPNDRTALIRTLDQLGIAHNTHDHAPIFTVEEGADIKAALPGGHTKNLFLKDKTGALFLICALGDTVVPINKLHKRLGCKRLSFGKPELLLTHLGVTPGSVTFFSILNDRDNHVQLVLDKALFEHDIVNFHPLKNDATTAIAAGDLLTFAAHTGHTPITIDFKALHEAHNTPSKP
ncbi:prolyl-tRNA synthetase associated domain-containing protein [Fretibacter rubidus]|uniref:prolyl-tRNA synthetase associated domain-containing protein n=1 Tax=Fretibacter rubidus TaxID=570162 RepID=UPI00352AD990